MSLKFTITLLFVFICLSAFTSPNYSKKVVISGVVENASPKKDYVEIAINEFIFQQRIKKIKIDKEGRFKCEFNISQPTDLWCDYRINFQIAVHPGDSIHVVLDGLQEKRPELLKTIKFGGTAGKLNQDIAFFQQKYYASDLYTFTDKNKRKREKELVKTLTPDEYKKYLAKQKSKIYNSFLQECNPCEEACLWADFYLTTSELKKITKYPSLHKKYNNLEHFTTPMDYYNDFLEVLPITDSMFICRGSVNKYSNSYHYNYARPKIFKESGGIRIPGNKNKPPTKEEIQNVTDSLVINGIIKYTSDSLLRQMILAEYFWFELERANINTYEKYNHIIQKHIKHPLLLNPLATYYNKTRKNVENPKLLSEQILRATSNSSLSELMDSVLKNHKNKIIYIDCWATWCSTCISEMPNSKVLMEKLKGKDVSFVYFCLDSEEKKWKAMIDRHQINGEHYLLSKKQSDEFRSIYEVDGIPHYIIIDKKGTVLGKDYNLRPKEAYGEIIKLLN